MTPLPCFVHGCITLIVFLDDFLLESLSIEQYNKRVNGVRLPSHVKDALIFIVSQTLIVLPLLEQVFNHLHIILKERVIQWQVPIVVFDIGAGLYSVHNLHILSVHAHYVLNCLSLIVLLPSRFEKVHLTRGIIEPIENLRIISAYSVKQRVLSFNILNQEELVLD
jgi:hypothetical protein